MPRGSWLRSLTAALVVVATVVVAAPAADARAAVPILVLDGTGWGHGVGLSQWGAEHLARTGRSTEEILGTFYPGVGLASTTGSVRVAVHRPAAPTTTLTFPQGGELRSPLEGPQAPGFPVAVPPGGRVRITAGPGGYRVDAVVTGQAGPAATTYQGPGCVLGLLLCEPTTTAPPTTTSTTAPAGGGAPPPTAAPGGAGSDDGPTPGAPGDPEPAPPAPVAVESPQPVWAVPAHGGVTQVDDRGRAYRGVVEATGAPGLRLVNLVGVEDYLRGMAEVPDTWPPAAVQAQTIAARTYALRAMQASGELCDDARCQVYVGQTAERPGQDAAVAATAGQVLTYGGDLAAAVYSADAGGVTATTYEGFGTPDGVYPYLTTVRYETGDPRPWRTEIGLADVARRLGYPGTLSTVEVVETGPSGRALQVALDGSAGSRTVDGRGFARALGLRSTRFTLGTSEAAVAPEPPPPVEEAVQALPEEVAAVARAPVSASRPVELRLEARLDRTAPPQPVADDPRARRLAVVAAVLALAVAVGIHVPVLLDAAGLGAPGPGARSLGRWRTSQTRSR